MWQTIKKARRIVSLVGYFVNQRINVILTRDDGKRIRLKKLPNKLKKNQHKRLKRRRDYPEMPLEYWFNRCMLVEERNDQLVREIINLKGGRPLTKTEIEEHNRKVAQPGRASG